MTHTKEKQFLGSLEAAAYLNVTYYRIQQMTKAGALKRVPGTRWYVRADLDRLRNGGGQNADSTRTD